MYSDINGLNLNSMEILEYIEMEDNEFDNPRAWNNNRTRMANSYLSNKIKMKAALAMIRLVMLYFFFYMDNFKITPFLRNLIGFLLIHEALVITNSLIVYMHQVINTFLFRGEMNIPSFCAYLDIFNNFLFFTWFVYGVLCILTDKDGIEESLLKNKMLTYYITVMIMLGFFIYSKLIFYIIFFVSFCPCITYVLCFDLHQEYQNNRRISRIHQRLKEETYEDFKKREGMELDMCIICTNEFDEKENVICLSCNAKHTFHAFCIRQWIDKKPICPLCRIDLGSEEIQNNNHATFPNRNAAHNDQNQNSQYNPPVVARNSQSNQLNPNINNQNS